MNDEQEVMYEGPVKARFLMTEGWRSWIGHRLLQLAFAIGRCKEVDIEYESRPEPQPPRIKIDIPCSDFVKEGGFEQWLVKNMKKSDDPKEFLAQHKGEYERQ